MKLGSRKERERESKCDVGKYKQFYEQDNEMDVAKAFWSICAPNDGGVLTRQPPSCI